MPTAGPKSRFRPTPAWLIFGLLVVEGLLWLSERYQWFWFNEKKGWTVLIAVASVGVMIVLMLLWFVASVILRWQFQFSIRSLLMLTIAVAIPCSWMMQEIKWQSKAVAAINGSGGQVTWSATEGPIWLTRLLGDDLFLSVLSVQWPGPQVTDADLEHLRGLKQVRLLLLDSTQVTDAGLEKLKGLKQLEILFLNETKITDAGLVHLKGLKQLKQLSVSGTKITDAGLEHLTGLKQIHTLALGGTMITDAGLEHLKELDQLYALWLNPGEITDAGLANLRGLTKLHNLQIGGTRVTDAGLENLKGLNQLRFLGIGRTKVTDAAVKKLRQSLPNCAITR